MCVSLLNCSPVCEIVSPGTTVRLRDGAPLVHACDLVSGFTIPRVGQCPCVAVTLWMVVLCVLVLLCGDCPHSMCVVMRGCSRCPGGLFPACGPHVSLCAQVRGSRQPCPSVFSVSMTSSCLCLSSWLLTTFSQLIPLEHLSPRQGQEPHPPPTA